MAEDEQRALGRVADELSVDELGVAGDDVRQDRVLDRVRRARGVLDLPLELVARTPRSCTGRSGRSTSTAVIWFIVRVPVLSELIADVDPSVSTDARSFSTAPCLASSPAPSDMTTWRTVGIASGIAAIASATALVNRPSRTGPAARRG